MHWYSCLWCCWILGLSFLFVVPYLVVRPRLPFSTRDIRDLGVVDYGVVRIRYRLGKGVLLGKVL